MSLELQPLLVRPHQVEERAVRLDGAGKIKRKSLILKYLAPLHITGKWLLLSVVVGMVAGIGAILFDIASQSVRRFALEGIAGYVSASPDGEVDLYKPPPSHLAPLKLIGVISVGGLLAGLVVFYFAPDAEGHGTDAAIAAFHHKRGYIGPNVAPVKLIASAFTIGTGGSGGREGPITQIGAAAGSFIGTYFKLPAHDRRILSAVGMGAGLGAIFRVPMAGALFAAEILYRGADLESEVIVPAAVSSIISYSVFSYWLPPEMRFVPIFGKHLQFEMSSVLELLPMTILAVVLVVVAVLFIKTFYGLHHWFQKSRLPKWFRPVIGAAITGVLALAAYWSVHNDARALGVLGTSYGMLQIALTDPSAMGFWLLATFAVVKILTTSFTIGSGGSGGIFGPSMVIGGITGAAVGLALHALWPHIVPQPQIFAIVGMAGFFAGAAHAPISTVIMVSELTGDYALLVPTMWVSTLCFLLCHRWTLYDQQLPSRLDSPAHRGDFLVDVLEGITVRDVPWKQRTSVFQGMPLKEIVHLIAESRQHYFPVVDGAGRFVGIFSTDDVRSHLYNEEIWHLANARDVMTTRVVSVTPEDDLNTALKRFTDLNLDELPVVDHENPSQLLGMLRRRDVIACYNQKLHDYQKADEEGFD
ncbi:MAG TPA: chloride channel protein [Lacipirellulaceae bacterium]|nr:chloride channel protein [Lacipirellulaceae bacterium]